MKPNPMERLINGIVKENPTFVLMLGMCPTLAVTTSAINGAGMGLSTTAVLMFSNMIISALRNVIPDRVRIPGYIVVIASLVTIVQFLLQGYVPAVNDALGLYIPLIVVNCIILGRAESFAAKNGPINSFFDGLGMGLGFTVALTILGAFRELLGAGQIFGMQVMPSAYEPITIFILAPGAFFVLACLVAIQNKVKSKKPKKAGEATSGGCGDCSHCGNSACGSRSFFDTTVEMKSLLLIAIGSALVNNVVLSQFLGLCPFLGVSKKVETAAGMGAAVLFVITIASAVTNLIYTFLLVPTDLTYLNTIVFILVIAALVQFVEMVLKKSMPALYESLGVFLPLITTNCAVLGTALTNVQNDYSFIASVVNGIGISLGFLIAIVILAGIREKMEYNNIPESFKGMPITLLTAGLMAIAFFGFSGLI